MLRLPCWRIRQVALGCPSLSPCSCSPRGSLVFPLYIAAEIGSLPVVRQLVEHGADVNKVTSKGCTSILNAAEEGKVNVVRYLLDHGADPYIRSNAGMNAIDAAMKAGQMQAAQIMRDYR